MKRRMSPWGAGSGSGRSSDSVAMASGVPELTANQEQAEIQEECSGKKKSKFQTFKKFFARKKRKEPAEAGSEAALKASQSSDDVSKTSADNTLTRAEKEKGSGSKISLGSKALSHDSVFVSDSSEANEALGASQDSIHGKVKSLQLQLKQAIRLGSPPSLMCVKKMDDAGTMSEDDGLPCSPPEYAALQAATNQAQRSRCNSLEGTDSDDEQLSYAASSRAVSPLVVPGDFSLPASPFSCLDNSAAKHKLGLRHKACNKRKPARRSEGRSLLEDTITLENEAAEEPPLTLQDGNADQPKPNVGPRQENDNEEPPQDSRRSLQSDKEEEEEKEEEMGAEQEVSLSLGTSCLHNDEKEEEREEEEEISDQQLLPAMDSLRETLEPPAGSSEMFLSSPEEENAARGDELKLNEMEEEESSFLHEVLSSLKTPLSSCSLGMDTDHVILEQKKNEGEKEKGVVDDRGEDQVSSEEEKEPENNQKTSVQALSDETAHEENEVREVEEEEEVQGEEEEKEEEDEEEGEQNQEEVEEREDEEEVQQKEEEEEVEQNQEEVEEREDEEEVQQKEEEKEEEEMEEEEEEDEVELQQEEEIQQEEEEEEEIQQKQEEAEQQKEEVEEVHQKEEEKEVHDEDEEEHDLATAADIKEKEVEEELSLPEDQIKSEEEAKDEHLAGHCGEEKEEEAEDFKPEEEMIIRQTALQAREEECMEVEETEEDKGREVMAEDIGDEDQVTETVPEEKAEEEDDDSRTKATDEIKSELQGGDLDMHSALISEDEEEEEQEEIHLMEIHSEQEETQQLDQTEVERNDDEAPSKSGSDLVEQERNLSEDAAVVIRPPSLSLEDDSLPPSPSKTTTLQINLASPTSPTRTASLKVSEEEEEQVCTGEEEESSGPSAVAETSCGSNQNKVRFTIAPAWQRAHSQSPPPSPPPAAASGKDEELEEPTEAKDVVSPSGGRRAGSTSPDEGAVIEKGNPDNPFGVRLRKTSGLLRFSSEEENVESAAEVASPENSQPASVNPPLSLPTSSKPVLPKKPDIHGDSIAKLKRVSDPAAGRSVSTASDSPSWISVAKQKQKIYKENSLEEINVKKEEQERKSSLPTYVSSTASREHCAKTGSQMETWKPSADKDVKRSLSPPTPVPPQPAKPQMPPCPVAPKPQLPSATAQRSLSPPTVVPALLKTASCTSPPNLFKPASPVTSPQFSLRTPPEKPAVPLVQPAAVQRGLPAATLPQDEPPWMALAKKKAKAWSEMPQIVQ